MKRIIALATALFAALLPAADAFACAVCLGDPDSKLVKGAEAGILLLLVVTYALLMGIIGIVVFWIIKARRLALPSAE